MALAVGLGKPPPCQVGSALTLSGEPPRFWAMRILALLLLTLTFTACQNAQPEDEWRNHTATKLHLIKVGDTRAQVIELLGVPSDASADGTMETLFYRMLPTSAELEYAAANKALGGWKNAAEKRAVPPITHEVRLLNGIVAGYGPALTPTR
jgi:hypothetical protein